MKYKIDIKEGLSLISHEIKNSLSGIKLGLEGLQDTVDDEGNEILETLMEELNHLREITLDTLTLTKPMELKLEKVNFKNMAEDVLEVVSSNDKKVELRTNFPEDFPEVLCDRSLIRSVFMNLVHNAYAEVRDKGFIEVGGEYIGDNMIKFWVSDNGKGIQLDKDSLFKKFKSNSGGFGIGLSLVKKIISEHYGEIEVDSSSERGTTFMIEMPSDFHFIDRRSGKDRRKSNGRRKEDK